MTAWGWQIRKDLQALLICLREPSQHTEVLLLEEFKSQEKNNVVLEDSGGSGVYVEIQATQKCFFHLC